MPSPITAANLLDLPGVRHGFFTREGGVSGGIYASLNCGLGSRDDADAVRQNRARVALWLGAREPFVLTPYQVHSAAAIIVDGPIPPGEVPRADGIVTRTRGLAIGILTADCASVLFADHEAGVVAAAHAGWRGAVGGVLEGTVERMCDLGARREHIHAAVGPCINQPSYEVGEDFEADLLARDPANAAFFRRPREGAKPHFDLPGYVGERLARLGLSSIHHESACTYAGESKFFSFRRTTHRREGDYGRQISAIVVT